MSCKRWRGGWSSFSRGACRWRWAIDCRKGQTQFNSWSGMPSDVIIKFTKIYWNSNRNAATTTNTNNITRPDRHPQSVHAAW